MRKKITFLFALLCASMMSFAIDWSGYAWLGNGGVDGKYSNKIKAVSTPELTGAAFINNLQMNSGHASIHIAMPSSDFGAISLDAADYNTAGSGFFPHLDAFKKQETEFTVVCSGTTYTFTVYYEDGEPDDLTGWNIAKGKTSVAGAYPADYEPYRANDGMIDNGDNRWASGSGAKHYAAVSNAAEDWWYVDLGGFYRVDQIKILFETAAPTDYDLLISNNAVSWTVLGTYTGQPTTGNAADKYNVYNFTDKVGRYVKIFARNGYNNMQYGISMYELEVYGDRATISDVNPPVMETASLSGTPSYDRVNITVSGTDEEDGAVVQFHVVDATHGVDQVQAAEAGVITVTELTAEITYSFTITALDAAGNESANSVNVAATTAQDTSIPTVAAPVPSGTGKEILPIYCDAFASILEHGFDKDGFAGVTLMMEQNISGDHCLVYNVAGANEVTWGHYNGTNDEICAQSEYRGSGMGVDASAMEYLHIDIWSLQAGTNVININVNDAGLTSLRLSHNGNGWQSYDIALSDFGFNPENPAYRSDNVRWMKFNGIGFISGKMALDNVYFWKTATGLHAVSATANNASFGTASVVVTETGLAPEGGMVTDGTEVTFSATPNDGYIFVDWSNGNTNATFNATVDAAMNLTANFRAQGTVYCNTEVTSTRDDDVHVAYATMKRTSANNYKLVVRSAETLGNFSNTTLQVNGSENLNLNNQGTLTDNNHVLTYEFTSTTPPSMTSGYLYLNVPGSKYIECWFTRLTNIEYEIPCNDDNVPVESISLNYDEATIEIGATKTLVVSFNPVYATDKSITWTSSNGTVASVDGGVVTANTVGTATITAETSNGKTATCAVTVEPVTEKTCWGTGTDFTYDDRTISWYYSVTRNENKTLTYYAEFSSSVAGLGNLDVVIDNDVWKHMTYNASTMSASYTTEGTYETGAVLNDFFYFEGRRQDFSYTVGSECAKPTVDVTGVSINHTSAELLVGETLTLSAEVVPANADDKVIIWENSDETVASFNTSTGEITALAEGTTTITAKSHFDEDIYATCVVTVSSAITAKTWYGVATFTPNEGLTGFTYSITRNTDRSLTFSVVLDKNPVGFVGEVCISGSYKGMSYSASTLTATYTTEANYAADGDALNAYWWLKSADNADQVDFTYTVGSKNDPLPQAVAVDEEKDNNAILTTYDGRTVVGVLGRSFTAGNLYTLVLPFDVDAAQTASQLPGQLTKLNNSYLKENGDLRINFVDVEAIEAGVPYLYTPSANITNPVFTGVTVSKDLQPTVPTDGYAEYHGIYAPTTGEELKTHENAYVLGSDQYLYAALVLQNDQPMKALRGYFVLNFSNSGANAPRARVIFNNKETEIATGISDVQSAPVQCTKVLRDGQLLIIRDGRTYNAQGQWIK